MNPEAASEEMNSPDPDVVYLGSSEEVAQRLGVTTAGLRRLADIYDTVYEPLKRDDRHNKRRLWTIAAISRLERARQLVQDERARSIKAALEMARDGTETPPQDGLAMPQGGSQHTVLVTLLEHVQNLEARLEAMQRQLEAPKDDADRFAHLERMNAHLLDELERQRQSPTTGAPAGDSGDARAGTLVRAATYIERLWRRVSGQGGQL